MANLATQVKLYLEANGKDASLLDEHDIITVRDDRIAGVPNPYIDVWNVPGLAQPTAEQLASYEAQAVTKEANEVVRHTRKEAYGNIGDQLDLLYKDIVANKLDTTGEWAKKIKAIKDANAKS